MEGDEELVKPLDTDESNQCGVSFPLKPLFWRVTWSGAQCACVLLKPLIRKMTRSDPLCVYEIWGELRSFSSSTEEARSLHVSYSNLFYVTSQEAMLHVCMRLQRSWEDLFFYGARRVRVPYTGRKTRQIFLSDSRPYESNSRHNADFMLLFLRFEENRHVTSLVTKHLAVSR